MGAFWIYGQCRIDDLFCAILHYVQLYYDYSTPFLEHTMRRNHPLQFDPVGASLRGFGQRKLPYAGACACAAPSPSQPYLPGTSLDV